MEYGSKCAYKGCDGCTYNEGECPGTFKCKPRGRAQMRRMRMNVLYIDAERRYWRDNKEKFMEQNKEWKKSNPDKVKEYKRKQNTKYKDTYFVSNAIRHHIERGDKVSVTEEEVMRLYYSTVTCRYCGVPLNKEGTGHRMDGPSLDRIDNDNVLDLDTIQIICRRCNITKSDLTHAEFVEYLKKVLRS